MWCNTYQVYGLPMTWSNDDPTGLNHLPLTYTPITEYEQNRRNFRNSMPDEQFDVHNVIADRNWEIVNMWDISIREYWHRYDTLPIGKVNHGQNFLEDPDPEDMNPHMLLEFEPAQEMNPRDRGRGAFMRNMRIDLERQAQLGWDMVADDQFEAADIEEAFLFERAVDIEERDVQFL